MTSSVQPGQSERPVCPRCGRALPADAPAGNCPACLAELGLLFNEPEAAKHVSAEQKPVGIGKTVFGAAVEDAGNEQPGERIGRYKLLQRIGEGGCGVVYVAEQEEPVRRRVALKVIKLGMDTRQVIARFEAERQALAMMDHPNIAKVHDGGTTETGRPYFVMELVRGVRITDYCDENNLSTTQRLDLFMQVCQAVQHAHQKGIIHRDLKPSNILVTINDGVPVPKVIDFGVAKAIEQRLTDKTIFTEFHQFIGTPAYMSPEQALMTSLDIDTRSDIYSLGVLLYELLTGRPPFDPRAVFAAGIDEVRRTIGEQEPPRPSNRLSTLPREDLTTAAKRRSTNAPQLIHAISGDLDWIVMKCLEKDRTRRYETANGLAADIQRHLNNEPIAARPPSRIYQFQRLARRNRVAFAATAAVLIAMLAGLALSTWAFVRERAVRKHAGIEAAKSQQVARFLKDMLGNMSPAVAMGRDTTLLREFADQTIESLGKGLTNQLEVELELRLTLGKLFNVLGDHRKAQAIYGETLPRMRSVFGNEHENLLDLLRDYAVVLEARGQYAEAEPLAREALAISRKRHGEEHDNVAFSLHVLAAALKGQRKFGEAEKLQFQALALSKKLHGAEHEEVARRLLGLALLYSYQGRATNAEPYFREALAMRKRLTHDAHPSVLEATRMFATFQGIQGNRAEEAELLRQLLVAQRKLLGGENRMVALTLSQLAAALMSNGQAGEALPLAREALPLTKRLYGGESIEAAKAAGDLGVALHNLGRHAESEIFARETLTIAKRVAPRDSITLDRAFKNLVLNLEAQEKFAEAEVLLKERLTLARENAANDPRNLEKLDECVADLADTIYLQKKYAEAEPGYRELIELRRRGHRTLEHDNILSAMASLGRLLAEWAWADRTNPVAASVGRLTSESETQNTSADGQSLVASTAMSPLERAREAERLLRECLTLRLKLVNVTNATVAVYAVDTTHQEQLKRIRRTGNTAPWRIGDTQSRLGSALLSVAFTNPSLTPAARETMLIDAETLLLEGNATLQQSKSADRRYKRHALERLIRLYQAWNKPVQLAECRAKLAAFNRTNTAPEAVAPEAVP